MAVRAGSTELRRVLAWGLDRAVRQHARAPLLTAPAAEGKLGRRIPRPSTARSLQARPSHLPEPTPTDRSPLLAAWSHVLRAPGPPTCRRQRRRRRRPSSRRPLPRLHRPSTASIAQAPSGQSIPQGRARASASTAPGARLRAGCGRGPSPNPRLLSCAAAASLRVVERASLSVTG